MKKILKISPFIIALLITLYSTYSYFTTSVSKKSLFNTNKYFFLLNAGEGKYENIDQLVINNNQTILPIPVRNGYTFLGYSDKTTESVDFTNQIKNAEMINNK